MSRSSWALAETRSRRGFVHGGAERRRFVGRLPLERRLLLGPVSATKYGVILLAAGTLAMAVDPGRALAAPGNQTQAHHAAPAVLALGSGYHGGRGALRVRSLQHGLDGAGYPPGPIDGRYGPRTEAAVEQFQRARGLRMDGIAGPLTLAALRTAVLYPGAGYADSGSAEVRGLQRHLRRQGYSPGPVDGRYGPLTERAVSRFQAAHGLAVDGIAGGQTLEELKRVAGRRLTAPRFRPRPRPRAFSRPTQARHPRQPRPATPRPVRPTTPARRPAGRPTGSSGASWPAALVAVGVLCLAALISGGWLVARRRRTSMTAAAEPADANTAPSTSAEPANGSAEPGRMDPDGLANGSADQQGDPAADCNLGVILERRGDGAGAEAAYRRADERGSADGAFNLAGLLLERGDAEGAMAAYRRADERGSADGAFNLASLLLERGDAEEAMAAYRRADERGDAASAVNLGVLSERRGDLEAAEAAYRRADARGSADGAFNLGGLLEDYDDLPNAAAAYHRAYERGDATSALKVGMLLERQGDRHDALTAYERAQQSDQPGIAELARTRAEALTLGLRVAGKRGER